MDFKQRTTYQVKIGQAFQPGTPINKYDLFAGRQRQISDIIGGINQHGQHIVIFGERGVGKTSLSKVLFEFLRDAGIDILIPDNINCDGTDDFPKIWYKVFREISTLLKTRNRETRQEIALDDDLFYDTPDDIRFVLNRLARPAIIVLDEVDRIKDSETTTLLADTIKNLSDHATPVTVILIGIADSVDELIREHRSVERALVQVHVPRMSQVELLKIINKGMQKAGLDFDAEACRFIVELSAGLPHYTHTLASHAANNAIDHDRTAVGMQDVNAAIHKTVASPGSLLSAYERATASSRPETLYSQVLLACALANKSDLGFFRAASIREPLARITGKHYDIPAFSAHLDAFCSEDRGSVLEKSGKPRQFRFRFVNPLLQPFVIIHGLSKGLLDVSMLTSTGEPELPL